MSAVTHIFRVVYCRRKGMLWCLAVVSIDHNTAQLYCQLTAERGVFAKVWKDCRRSSEDKFTVRFSHTCYWQRGSPNPEP